MYQSLLTNRYLSSRVIPFIAVAAVAMCVALVIIVVSVMTGFLNLVKNSGKTLMGDVVVAYPVTGIPFYEDLISRIEALPDVAAATPIVDSFGLLKMPYPIGDRKEIETVQMMGIEPISFAEVTGYGESLYWRPLTDEQRDSVREDDFRRSLPDDILETALQSGLRLRDERTGVPEIAIGIQVSKANERQRDGSFEPMGDGYWWMRKWTVTLTTIPVYESGLGEAESFIFPVANEFVSGVYMIDEQRVMAPIDVVQKMLHLDEAKTFNEATGEEGIDPARATMILVRARHTDEYPAGEERRPRTPDELRAQIDAVYDEFFIAMEGRVPSKTFGLRVMTWEEQQAAFIKPVEKERELMRTLFMLIYIVCAGLVLAIFWSIVYEKTRDIGILRSIGASRMGISWIFIRYGFVVGTLGAIFGFGLGVLVVHNINVIHDAMGDPPISLAIGFGVLAAISLALTIMRGRSGRLMPIVLGTMCTTLLAICGLGVWYVRAQGGIQIWSPEVYYFSRIPNEVDYGSAVVTMIGAVVFSLIGAFLPAAKAADTDPVTALRYE